MRSCLAAVLFLASSSVHAQVQGVARAIDGDSLTVGEQEVRLFGIDAPEYRQTCEINHAAWSCGADSASALRRLIDGRYLSCISRDRDVYGRTVASCLVESDDVGAILVRGGQAVVLQNGRADYGFLEDQARRANRGIWASKFMLPAEYRRSAVQEERTQRSSARAKPSYAGTQGRSGGYQYVSCAKARAAGVAPMYRGQSTYNPNLDGDGDGIACEPYRVRR